MFGFLAVMIQRSRPFAPGAVNMPIFIMRDSQFRARDAAPGMAAVTTLVRSARIVTGWVERRDRGAFAASDIVLALCGVVVATYLQIFIWVPRWILVCLFFRRFKNSIPAGELPGHLRTAPKKRRIKMTGCCEFKFMKIFHPERMKQT